MTRISSLSASFALVFARRLARLFIGPSLFRYLDSIPSSSFAALSCHYQPSGQLPESYRHQQASGRMRYMVLPLISLLPKAQMLLSALNVILGCASDPIIVWMRGGTMLHELGDDFERLRERLRFHNPHCCHRISRETYSAAAFAACIVRLRRRAR